MKARTINRVVFFALIEKYLVGNWTEAHLSTDIAVWVRAFMLAAIVEVNPMRSQCQALSLTSPLICITVHSYAYIPY